MLELLNNWKGKVEIDDKTYDNIENATNDFKRVSEQVHIRLYTNTEKRLQRNLSENRSIVVDAIQQYKVTVKKYMTQKGSPEFDFMTKWNNDVPMPLRTMIGTVEKETRGMVYMKLHGDIYAERICTCMRCGRVLTNPVSQYFGIGPECGGHNYINPFNSQEELREAVSAYKQQLQNIKWEGWIIKSAILEKEELK